MNSVSSTISKSKWRTSRFALLLAALCMIAITILLLWIRFGGSGSPAQQSDVNTSATEDMVEVGADVSFQLSLQQQRGKQIYLTGISPTGASMTAVLGNTSTEVPAAVLTCVNCHRHDGRGKPEGGIYPSNIRWDELSKPYGSTRLGGRTRPPYDESSLKRSIAMGLGPGGERLNDAMPRYRMAHQDLADLVAYLTVIGKELDPGISASKVRIGVILAPERQFPEMNLAVRAAVNAYVSDLNEAGGVYQREIEVCFTDSPARLSDRAEAAVDFVKREQVFALTSSFIAGAEDEISRRLGEEGVPLVGAMALYPQVGFPLNRHLFYLSSGVPGQSLALAKFAYDRHSLEPKATVLLVPSDEHPGIENAGNENLADENVRDKLRAVADTVQSLCEGLGWRIQRREISAREFQANDLARALRKQEVRVVFSLLSAQQNLRLLKAADGCDWLPECYLPGAIVGPELFDAPTGFNQRIFLSFPTLPSKQVTGMNEHRALGEKHGLPTAQLSAQFEALGAVKTMVHGLNKAGANLSRERLVEELETLDGFRTGFTPPLTFGLNRRVGARGANVVAINLINKKLESVSEWVDVSSASRLGL